MAYPGTLMLIVGSSGSGKGALLRRAMKAYPQILYPLSTTTRKPRPQESDGTHYRFISKETFEAKIAAGEFLEWANIDGKLYGTQRSEVVPALEEGKLAITEMDIQGVRQIKKILPKENIVTVYIDAGGWETLARRIQGRAPISAEELASRRARYEYEKDFKKEADYVVDNPDGKFKEADAAFEALVTKLLPSA